MTARQQRVPAWPCILALVSWACFTAAPAFAAGSVIAWGNNSDGQCQVPAGLTGITGLAAGDSHSLALKSDGTVTAWGLNVVGQCDVPAGLSNVTAISARGLYSMALQSNGTVVAWGDFPALPPGLANVTAIAAGNDHCLALRSDGTLVTWGEPNLAPPPVTNVIAIAAGDGHSLALTADGTVIGWGTNEFLAGGVPASLTNVAAIAAGRDHCLALRQNGTVVAWGSNLKGQTNVPPGLSNVVAIAAGAEHSLVVKADGTLAAWGDNTFGQTNVNPAPAEFVLVASGSAHNLAIRGDGKPVITVQPVSQAVGISKTATFRVIATGLAPLFYQWAQNGTNLPSGTNLPPATNALLVLNDVQMTNAGVYTVTVSNLLGLVRSAAAVLTPIGLPPVITTPPVDQSTLCGEGAEFSVVADGSAPLAYQWQFGGVDILGAISNRLSLTNVFTTQAGAYSVVVTNEFGAVTSAPATLDVVAETPTITSPLMATAKQGAAFSYQIVAQHSPESFSALNLPPGLSLDPQSGRITGAPLVNGAFGPIITANNACSSDSQLLTLFIASSVPVITSSLETTGTEGAAFSYRIRGSDTPASFGAEHLPVGLAVNPLTGYITGTPVYGGEFYSVITASNQWGVGSATLHSTFANAAIPGLAIHNLSYTYSSPWLLDFQFTLLDNEDPLTGNPVVVEPRLLSVTCMEDDVAISPSETAVVTAHAAAKLLKANLVLDFSESVASLSNGDTNLDDISDAVDAVVYSAQSFISQQAADAQIGVYEFHRDDMDPQQVVPLTTDRALLNSSIAGIWTNYVDWYPGGSRCWDAVLAAVNNLGASNADEQHYVIFISDGKDESSASTVDDVIAAATNNNVRVYCVGFGSELDSAPLQQITSQTLGRYYEATDATQLALQFAQLAKELNAQYVIRWATLKRTKQFMPSFEVSYQGWIAHSPTNPYYEDTNNPIIDTNSTPPTTNYPLITNYIIEYYVPSQHTGSVTTGTLRLVSDADIFPTGITLRAAYTPRYVRQFQLHYRPNWPCTPVVQSTNTGETLHNWTVTQTEDGDGGYWLLLSSPYPQSSTNSLPFAFFGNLLTFRFRDIINPSNAFSFFEIDNTIYTNTGRQSFGLETNSFLANYALLPYGTPVPWLMANGFTSNFEAAELSDPDGDGIPTWQEYQANTDPQDPLSRFAITTLTKGFDGRQQVAFTTALNRFYRVESSADLVNWEIVQEDIAGTGAEYNITDTRLLPGARAVFYRVAVY